MEINPWGDWSETSQIMVNDSKTKLGHIVEHKFYEVEYIERRLLVLQGIVEELHRDLQKSREKQQSRKSEIGEGETRNETETMRFGSTEEAREEQSGNNEDRESDGRNKQDQILSGRNDEDREELSRYKEGGHQNESRSIEHNNDQEPSSENKLLMLLDIEEGLRTLRHRIDYVLLWRKFVNIMRHEMDTIIRERPNIYYVERFDEHEDYILRMLWESNDSVWLLKTDPWGPRQWPILQKVRDFTKHIYSADIKLEQYPKTQPDREQLLSMFRERLIQWKTRLNFLQHQCSLLDDMLKYWPQHRQVRTHCFDKKRCMSLVSSMKIQQWISVIFLEAADFTGQCIYVFHYLYFI